MVSPTASGLPSLPFESEDESERLVDCTQLVSFQATRGRPEALRIDHGRLLDESPGFLADVGATSVVPRPRNSSACTTTA